VNIQIGVERDETQREVAEMLSKIGFTDFGECGVPGRLIFASEPLPL
jgi:hypothetical protein